MSDTQIPLSIPCLGGNEARYLQECVEANLVSSVGPFVNRFECEFAEYVGSTHAVACSSGTAALHIALIVAGVGPGDEVLVSDFTFVATVNPIIYLGAKPVLVDADPATWNIDAGLVVDEIEARARRGSRMPKAVVVAHVLGLVADLEPIVDVCQRHGVVLIEDAAEALGAGYVQGPFAGRQVGTVGAVGCYSFNGNKIMTTGGGGMVVTPDAALAERAKHLTTQARVPGHEYRHDEVGYNYRLTNIASALGIAQLEQLDGFVARKREIACVYDGAWAEAEGVVLPPRPEWAGPTNWLYSIRIESLRAADARSALIEAMARQGIQIRPLWTPVHMLAPYREAECIGGRVGRELFDEGVSLPSSVSLQQPEQERVISCLRTALDNLG